MNTYTVSRSGETFTVILAGEPGQGGHEITDFPSDGMVLDWLRGTLGVEVRGPLPIGESMTYS